MNRFDGLRDVDDEIMSFVSIRMDEFFKREEGEPVWDCLYKEETELEYLKQEHPNLALLIKASVGGLGEALEDDLEPEAWVWFRYSCLNSFLEILGAIAESYRRSSSPNG
jgi:hypothetical protein